MNRGECTVGAAAAPGAAAPRDGRGVRRVALGRVTALGAAGVAACGGPGAATGGGARTAEPVTIEVLHEFGPTSADGRWMGELLERIKQQAPQITVRSTLAAGG